MKTKQRLLVCCLLVVMTVGLCVQYAGAEQWPSPTPEEIAADSAAADGQTRLVFTRVRTIDLVSGEIRITSPPFRVDIRTVDPAVVERLEPGAAIQVYGTIRSQSEIDAERIVIDYATSSDSRYTYATSILGVLLAAGVFLRFWRINWRELGFEPRGDD